ncbi:MAG: S8 family serine peptidase, partial [Acidimicrobiia bacterium]|nr:S8 family serine peptidase [Acidimicrobiia bacterium]
SYPEAGVAVVLTGGRPVDEVLRQLGADPRVRTATPDRVRRASVLPDDPEFPSQRADLEAVRLPDAWDVTTGARNVVVAVIDSGVDLDHPDLAPKLLAGFDVVERDGRPDDDLGHGTFVAGIAAARTDNAIGIAGAAWRSRILPVKVLDSSGFGSDSRVIEGLDWAVDHGADVVNLSLGGPDPNPALDAAVADAVARGVVVVAATGNEADTRPNYPAASPGALGVGAASASGRLTYFSNNGDWLDLVAPGFDVVSTTIGSYATGSGTSFAAPFVAGAAALVRAVNPTFSPADVAARLLATTKDLGAQGVDPQFGRGMLDVAAALGRERRPVAAPSVDGDGTPARARAVALGSTPAAGSIGPEGDVDWFRFDVAAPTTLRVRVTPAPFDGSRAAELSPVLRVHGPGLGLLAEVRHQDPELADRVRPATMAFSAGAGTHYVSVRNGFGSRGVPAYDLSVAEVPPPGTPPPLPGAMEWVRDATPVERTAAEAPGVAPTVTFGRDLAPGSVSSGVRLYGGLTGKRVPASVTYDPDTRTATLTPAAPLRPGRPYYLRVLGVADGGGQVMQEPYRAPFTVG